MTGKTVVLRPRLRVKAWGGWASCRTRSLAVQRKSRFRGGQAWQRRQVRGRQASLGRVVESTGPATELLLLKLLA